VLHYSPTSSTEKKIKAFEKKIKNNKVKDHSYYEDVNFIYEIKSFLIVDRALTDNFRDMQLKNNMKLFLITILESVFYMIVEEQRVNVKHRYEFLEHSLKYMKDHLAEFEDSPLLMIKVAVESDHCVYIQRYDNAMEAEWKLKKDTLFDIIECLSDETIQAWETYYRNNEDAYFEGDNNEE